MASFAASPRDNINTDMDYSFEEPMDTSETPYHSDSEEGEIKAGDDEVNDVSSKKYINIPSKRFFGNYDLFGEDENLKKTQRAERFGLTKKTESTSATYKKQYTNLRTDLGINEENERHYRFNAIHMRGIEDMTTDDVLQYFSFYDPSIIEWVDDVSCNIVWLDDVSASRALLNLSRRIKNLDKVQTSSENNSNMLNVSVNAVDKDNDLESVDVNEIKGVIPPGFWRLGKPSKNIHMSFLRFAARSDKKQTSSEKNKDYYKIYSDPHYGNVPGTLSKSVTSRMKMSKYNHQSSSVIWGREQKSVDAGEKKNPWEELAYDWGKTDKVEEIFSPVPKVNKNMSETYYSEVSDLRLALKNKKEWRKRLYKEDDAQPLQSDFKKRKKLPRMKMYADDEERKLDKNSAIIKPIEDLRSKINRKKNIDAPKLIVARTEVEKAESSSSENEYYNEDVSSSWALENYQDLRDSLRHNRRESNRRLESVRYKSDDESDSDIYTHNTNDIDFDVNNIGQRSPLQIEIDNDEYYQNSNNKR